MFKTLTQVLFVWVTFTSTKDIFYNNFTFTAMFAKHGLVTNSTKARPRKGTLSVAFVSVGDYLDETPSFLTALVKRTQWYRQWDKAELNPAAALWASADCRLRLVVCLLPPCSSVTMEQTASVNADPGQRSDSSGGFDIRQCTGWLLHVQLHIQCVAECAPFLLLTDRCTKWRNWTGFWWATSDFRSAQSLTFYFSTTRNTAMCRV